MPRKSVASFLQLFSTNVVSKACWALILLLLLRKLGASAFGVLATLWSAAAIAAGFIDFGTGQVVLREGSRDSALARHLAVQSARVEAILTIWVAALLAVGAWSILHVPELSPWQRMTVIVLGVTTPLLDRFQALFTVCSQVGGSYGTYAKTRSAYFVVLVLAIVWVLWRGGGLLAVSVIYFALTATFALMTGLGTWRLLPPADPTRKAPPVGTLLKQGLPFLMVMTLTLAYGRIEVTLLGAFGRSAEAGSYHVIYQLVLLVYSIAGMFFTIAYPRLYQHRGNNMAMTTDFRDTVRWLSLLGWIAALPLWLFAEPVLHLMGGAPLAACAPQLRVLAAMILIIPASAALNFLLPADRLRARIICDAVGIAITATITTWAAVHDQALWVAVGAVIGYTTAIAMAHVALHGTLARPTGILLAEFSGVGLRVVPPALLARWMPGPWWVRLCVFAAASAILLLFSYLPIRQRMSEWLAHTNP